METKRLEWKVGLFVLIGLLILMALMVQFSKGVSLFRGTYELLLRADNVGGLKPRSGVLLAGVQVGTVSDISLAGDGQSVAIRLKIYSGNRIYRDARFLIEQSGFLGDEFVSIVPKLNQGGVLTNRETILCEAPLNLQEVARSAASSISRIDLTATRLNDAIADVRRLVLNEQTLTNLAQGIGTLRVVADHALVLVDNADAVLETNRSAVALTLSNLVAFSTDLDVIAGQLREVVNTNRPELQVTLKNLSTSSADLKQLLEGAQAGKGLAGTMLKNEAFAANVSAIAQNLSVTASNLNRLGLWRVLFPKPAPKIPSSAN